MVSWRNPFKKKEPIPEPVEQLPPAPSYPLPILVLPGTAIFLKKGKWITVQGRVGIVANLDTSGYAEVHYTNLRGETVEVQRVHSGMLKLARLDEIPSPRRPVNPAKAALLGYV